MKKTGGLSHFFLYISRLLFFFYKITQISFWERGICFFCLQAQK